MTRHPRRDSEPLETWNARNGRLLCAINERRRIHLSSTTLPHPLGPVVTLRACVLSFRTGAAVMARAIEDIVSATHET